jgi:hypothetical protein
MLVEQTVARVGEAVDAVFGPGPTDDVDVWSRRVVGRYIRRDETEHTIRRLKAHASDKSTLVVIIADECHWGTGIDARIPAAPAIDIPTSEEDPTTAARADADDIGRKGANNWVRTRTVEGFCC